MKYFIYIKENSQRVKFKNFLKVRGLPLWRNLIKELEGQDVYIDTDSEDVYHECQKISHVTCYKRLEEHIKLEQDPKFKVSPALLMIDRFLDMYVKDEHEIIDIEHDEPFAVIFHPNLIHTCYPNTSDEYRYSVAWEYLRSDSVVRTHAFEESQDRIKV